MGQSGSVSLPFCHPRQIFKRFDISSRHSMIQVAHFESVDSMPHDSRAESSLPLGISQQQRSLFSTSCVSPISSCSRATAAISPAAARCPTQRRAYRSLPQRLLFATPNSTIHAELMREQGTCPQGSNRLQVTSHANLASVLKFSAPSTVSSICKWSTSFDHHQFDHHLLIIINLIIIV